MRRMRQLLELDSGRSAAAPSPVPTPSGTLPRGQRQLDINPAGRPSSLTSLPYAFRYKAFCVPEFLKYKIDKVGGTGPSLSGLSLGGIGGAGLLGSEDPVSGMLWVHLLAGRGLRPSTGTSTATTPVTPSGGAPTTIGSTGLRDLYCVLECDRVHKARTVVRAPALVLA